jgi:hypothetical protein
VVWENRGKRHVKPKISSFIYFKRVRFAKTGVPNNFCFIKLSPSLTNEAAETFQTLFWTPGPFGLGHGAQNNLRIISPLSSIPVPNLSEISLAVWISIENIHTNVALYLMGIRLSFKHCKIFNPVLTKHC